MFNEFKRIIERQGAEMECDKEEVRIICNEDNELFIRDILAVNNIVWVYDDTCDEAVICIDWDNLNF